MTTPTALTRDQQAEFLNLACQLSPENISCDGEATAIEVERKRRTLLARWRFLEKEVVGRTVTEDEVWTNERRGNLR
jgi:hypothetical protein